MTKLQYYVNIICVFHGWLRTLCGVRSFVLIGFGIRILGGGKMNHDIVSKIQKQMDEVSEKSFEKGRQAGFMEGFDAVIQLLQGYKGDIERQRAFYPYYYRHEYVNRGPRTDKLYA